MYVSYIFCYSMLVVLVSSTTFTPPDILWLDENEVCKRSIWSGKTHECKVLTECKTAIQDIRENVKYPTICSFRGKIPVVCCAPESMPRVERLAGDEKTPDISPGVTLHFESYKDGSIHDNLITYSRPRRRISSRILQKKPAVNTAIN